MQSGVEAFRRRNIFYLSGCNHIFCVCVHADVEFKAGEIEHVVEVEVLFDGVREMREAFTVHLKPDENMVAEIQVRNVPCGSYLEFNMQLM